jgi:hypothetical protein
VPLPTLGGVALNFISLDPIHSYPRRLRGFSQNRFGGQQSQNLRTYGGKFGATGPVRRLNSKERKAVEADLKKRGVI